jgi:23S rRNA (adenine2503-C2)-methyltransferase
LMKAIRIINGKEGMNIGARRITVSTCGVIPKIQQLAKEGLQIELAISLHGFDNASRNILMPVNKKYPFDNLMTACREYIKKTKRQITFEYILIKDVTCSIKAAKSLKKAFRGLICKMNLIPYNPVAEFEYKTPSRAEMFGFKNRLEDFGIHATIRTPRGRDIAGACGQLRHSEESC